VPTGAIVAAPTTSLPERIGGDRNYDYRYAWVRDTAFTLDAPLKLGLLVQVHASLNQATKRSLYVSDGNALDDVTGKRLADAVDRLTRVWNRKDAGIWELPDKQHYTSSKLASWMAIDRALRLAEQGELPGDRVDRWRETAAEIRAFVERECWSENRRGYAMDAGSDRLDASVLRISRMNYLDARGERFNSTIARIRTELSGGGPLLYRYTGQRQERVRSSRARSGSPRRSRAPDASTRHARRWTR
jgi:GH15 family glucan-1,4-alpha-glucosidase